MARRRAIAFVAAVFLIASQATAALAASAPATAGSPRAERAAVESGLLDRLRDGSLSRFVVEFTARTDLRAAASVPDRTARAAAVREALVQTAVASNGRALGLAKGERGVRATARWLTNVVIVEATVARGHRPDAVVARRLAALAEQMAGLPGVANVRAERVYPLVEPVTVTPLVGVLAAEPEWGVAKIRADQAWNDGITGSGIVVANIDTGVEFDHEALVRQYRGNQGVLGFDHNYNWWDPSGICGDVPCDNAGHGTHTMGTIVGGDADGPLPDIGVAPDATWVAAKGCEDFSCSESSLLSAGEWVIAPTDLNGGNPDPSRHPDIVSNSWGSDDPNDTFYLDTVVAWRAAGIIPVFAAGNAGPGCGSAGTPGNFSEVISAGATDIDDVIAPFSSRGPSPTDKVSPNVSAPGVDVISSVPGNGYESFSGTSMATPHVAGTVALMLSAEPALAGDFDGVLAALNQTALDIPDDQCGAPEEDLDPNFVYGEGRIDAKAAVDLVKSGGTLAGSVRDADTNAPIAGARVSASDGERTFSTTTDAAGAYSLFLAAGTYAVSATAFGYQTAGVFGTVIETDVTTTENFDLEPLPRFTVSGTVTGAEAGGPLADAFVEAVGTPVAPVTSDATGHYELILPIGSYTLRASLGGCTDAGLAEIESLGDDVIADFALARKLDAAGHACRPIPFAWVDAEVQSALYGDEFAGRLRLPFSFPFYDASYDAVFLSDNGYLNFLEADQFNAFPVDVPSPGPPNGAIYALWQDLRLDDASAIDYDTVGSAPNRAFVIEYSGVRAAGSTARLTFEVKLWEDGTIDLLYGDNRPNPGDGRNALVGIENADGSDALSISFRERLLAPNRAIRIETVPVGTIEGIVTDANDGEPIDGATVSALPGHRSVKTDSLGRYSLNLLAGSYQLTAEAGTWTPDTVGVVVVTGETQSIDFSLAAPTAVAAPTTISETVEFGQRATVAVVLSNDGSAALNWDAKERDRGFEPPDLPPAVEGIFRTPSWHRVKLPADFPVSEVRAVDPASLPVIIDDPDDSFGTTELLRVRGQSDSDQANFALEFGAGTPFGTLGGYFLIDTDQDPSTGFPPEFLFGLPTQDIGFDYFAYFFDVPFTGTIPIFDLDGNLVAEVPATVDGGTLSYGIPLSALGADDGNLDVTMVVGSFGPEDWAPDVGHGSVSAFTDLPWLTATPSAGSVGANDDDLVSVELGGPSVGPGTYRGELVFVSNAPRSPQVSIEVTLEVTVPDEFGRVEGTVSDAHSGNPLPGATVTVHSEWMGAPFDLATTSGVDGAWSVIGPAGTWPTDVALDGYVPASIEATIAAGVTTGGADAAMHRDQAHAALEGGPLTFVLRPGRTGHGTITLSNPEGHADLEFEVFERPVVASLAGSTAAGGGGVSGTSAAAPVGHVSRALTPSIEGQPSVVLMDVLPWGSDAIQQVLDANGIAYDVAGSAELPTLDLAPYHAIYVGNDQPQSFYNALFARFDDLTSFVAGGGVLWFGAAAFGFENGNLDGATLPGGLTVHGPVYEDFNDVLVPEHPLLAGAPNPIFGTSASHVSFSDLPPGATALAAGQGSGGPTLVEYDFGAGRVIAVGLTVEFGWANGQDNAIVLENGVPYVQSYVAFVDLPWLSIDPASGTVAPDGSIDLDAAVDSTDLEPGVYRASVVIRTSDPDHAAISVPVTLVVPAYQQGVNAGGTEYVNANGDVFAADQSYGASSFGYVGASSTRRTGAAIDGTADDPLYQHLRVGMTGYRFDVPNGTYRVDLRFAELQARHADDRVFNVFIEEGLVLPNFDVFAAGGGLRVAVDRTFVVEVTDGHLDIAFAAQRGDAPIVGAILVTDVPTGAPME